MSVLVAAAAENVPTAIEAFGDFFDFMTQDVSKMCEQFSATYPEVEGIYLGSLPSRAT